MNYSLIAAHIKSIDPTLAVTVVVGLLGLATSLWIALRSGQIHRPRLEFAIGVLVTRGYSDYRHPIRHAVWLVQRGISGSTLSIPFLIENKSSISVRNLKIDIEYKISAYIPNEDLRKLLMETGEGDLAIHPFLQSRNASRLDSTMRVHYEVDVLHPGTDMVGTEIMRWEASPKAVHHDEDTADDGPEDDRFSGTGFENIVQRIRALEGFGSFDLITVTYTADNLKPRTHFLNLSVLRTDKKNIRDLAMSIDPDQYGDRIRKLKKSGTAAEAFLNELSDRYTRCFWMGDRPRLVFVPFPLRLQRAEMMEVVPVISAQERTEKEKHIARKHGLQPSALMIGTSVSSAKIWLPWRNYYKFPRWVNSIEKVIWYHFGSFIGSAARPRQR